MQQKTIYELYNWDVTERKRVKIFYLELYKLSLNKHL